MKKSIFLLFASSSLFAFSQNLKSFSYEKDIVSERTVIIEPYKQLSNGAFFMDLTLVSDNPYIDYIEGFDFEWGYRYQLVVQETIFANPPQDASDRTFELVKVNYQIKAYEEPFTLTLINEKYLSNPSDESIIKLKNGYYNYHDSMTFFVPPKLRAEFNRKMKQKMYCKGLFQFDKQGKIYLVKIE